LKPFILSRVIGRPVVLLNKKTKSKKKKMTDLNNYINKDTDMESKIFNYINPTLIEVRAEWSGGSHLMDLIVIKIEQEYHQEINIVRIDFEAHKESLNSLGIDGAPAFLFINKGEIIEIIKETLSRKSLEKIIRKLYQKQCYNENKRIL
jgi:thioredoxin-like negative regulator of GroEL